MRDYGKVAPQFWTGDTGKKLKTAGPEAIVVAMYLMTSPHANMIGLYYLPKMYLAHETGLGEEGACKGLARASEAGFCTYDEASEYVFVHAMARFQIADALKPDDKRCKGIENELSKVPKGPLALAFRTMYASAFHLQKPDKTASPLEGPSKSLRSQEQEQEQKQEQDNPPRKRLGDDMLSGLPAQLVADFTAHRKAKKAPITQTAVDGIRREADKAGYSMVQALQTCIERNWVGFKADWLQPNGQPLGAAEWKPGGGRKEL